MAPPWIAKTFSDPSRSSQDSFRHESQSEIHGIPEVTHCTHAPTETTTPLPTLQARIWNNTYDYLKKNEAKTVEKYEKILSARLRGQSSVHVSPEDVENEIEKEPGARCQQMQQLVQAGLDRTQKEVLIKQGLNQGLQVVQTLRGIVDKAVQASPAAAIAWPCVCLGLEILANPISEPGKNRQGIIYVLSRMDWYWNLVGLLLEENKARETATESLRCQLENHIIQLYRKLLLYQMKSICLYHRNWVKVIGRDIFKRDDWGKQLEDIKEAEVAVEKDSDQYNSQNTQSRLQDLADTAHSQEEHLGSIDAAIQDQTRQQEMRYQTDSDKRCRKHLFVTDPSMDKERIQDTRGGLLRDAYLWILENADFKRFRNEPQSRLLWILGDPGKGKTMLLCGIIDELQKESDTVLCYFFCQATEPQLRSATSVLRGLMYLLLDKRPSLVSHLRVKWDTQGEKLFQGINVWVSLVDILTDMLHDPTLTDAVFVVDALDECIENRAQLLDFITKLSNTCPHVKWVISSRNWPEIEQQLDTAKQKVRLRLEANQNSISDAVATYIDHKVDQLVILKNYDKGTSHSVRDYLAENAGGTFLWVALVCRELADPRIRKRHTLAKLQAYPPGLNPLYSQMMQHINDSADAVICKQILATSSTVYRPVSLRELKIVSGALEDFDQDELREITMSCASFLTIREDIVYFVHHSAKDYLINEASDDILPYCISDLHRNIFLRSIKALSQTLQRDIYDLGAPGVLVDEISTPEPDPLEPVRYSTVYWVDHFHDSKSKDTDLKSHLEDSNIILDFIQRKYLYWLESLSLRHCLTDGVAALQKLEDIARRKRLQLLAELLQDARRFILSHKSAIEVAPLQLYASALLFSPANSKIRVLFKKEEPDWVTLNPIRVDWGLCLQTLEGHSGLVNSVAFSHDSQLVASASDDATVRIWRADTGECTQTLEGHSSKVNSVAFSHDSQLVASASSYGTVRIWRADTGECTQTLESHSGRVNSVAFSHDLQLVASASGDATVRIWRADTGECTQTLEGHRRGVNSVAFSHDSQLVASASNDATVRIWRADTGECTQTLEGHSSWVTSVAFSHDSQLVASASFDGTVRIWRADTGECTQTLEGHSGWRWVNSVAFSHDSQLVASASNDATVRIWRADTGECTQTLEGHSGWVMSVAFSHDSQLVASASDDQTVRIWRADAGECTQTLEGHSSKVMSVAFSHDSQLVASASFEGTVRIWRADMGECTQTLEGHRSTVRSVAFSHDSQLVASASADATIRIWRADTGECTQTLEGHRCDVNSVAFSHDSQLVASASSDETVRIWRADTGECTQTLEGHTWDVNSVAFSHDSQLVASASGDETVRIWRADTGECMQVIDTQECAGILSFEPAAVEPVAVNSVAFSHDSQLVASASDDQTVRIWRADTGECMQVIDTQECAKILSFEPDRIFTTLGVFTVLGNISVYTSTDVPEPLTGVLAHRTGYGISLDKRWVTFNRENTLWLPMEFRPICSSVSETAVAIGCSSGRVIVLDFSSVES